MGVVLREKISGGGTVSIAPASIPHNSLTGIQGGATDANGNVTEAYHLTEDAYNNMQEFANIFADDIEMNHNDLLEIQGGVLNNDGKAMEAYHLSSVELSQVQFLLAHYDELMSLLSEGGR